MSTEGAGEGQRGVNTMVFDARCRDAFSERLAGHDFLSLSGHSFGSGKLHRQRVYTHDSCATSAPQWDHGIGQHAAGRGACLLGAGAEGGGRRSEKGGGKGSGLLSTHPARMCAIYMRDAGNRQAI